MHVKSVTLDPMAMHCQKAVEASEAVHTAHRSGCSACVRVVGGEVVGIMLLWNPIRGGPDELIKTHRMMKPGFGFTHLI